MRLHALDRFGEAMDAYRHTINKAMETGAGIGGLEQGAFGLSIRSVVPVFHEEKLVGTVEFGLSFEESLLQHFKKDYGADLTLYVEKGSGANEPTVFASTLNKVRVPFEIFNKSTFPRTGGSTN